MEGFMQKTFQVKQADRTRMYPLGVSFEEEGLRISAVCEGAGEAGIILYDKRHREGAWVPFPETAVWGRFAPCCFQAIMTEIAAIFFTGERRFIRIPSANVWKTLEVMANESHPYPDVR